MIDGTGETEAHRRPDGHDGTSPAYSVMLMMMMMMLIHMFFIVLFFLIGNLQV